MARLVPDCDNEINGGIAPSRATIVRYTELSSQICSNIAAAISFCRCDPTSTISTKTGIPASSTNTALASGNETSTLSTNADLSTIFEPKSAINSTKGFIIPASTALILFSFREQREYRAVDASFLPRKFPFSRRFTSSGIAPDRPIAALFSSIWDNRSKAQAC